MHRAVGAPPRCGEAHRRALHLACPGRSIQDLELQAKQDNETLREFVFGTGEAHRRLPLVVEISSGCASLYHRSLVHQVASNTLEATFRPHITTNTVRPEVPLQSHMTSGQPRDVLVRDIRSFVRIHFHSHINNQVPQPLHVLMTGVFRRILSPSFTFTDADGFHIRVLRPVEEAWYGHLAVVGGVVSHTQNTGRDRGFVRRSSLGMSERPVRGRRLSRIPPGIDPGHCGRAVPEQRCGPASSGDPHHASSPDGCQITSPT